MLGAVSVLGVGHLLMDLTILLHLARGLVLITRYGAATTTNSASIMAVFGVYFGVG